jgi:hypothetical protein
MSEQQPQIPQRRKFLLDSALSVIGIASLPFLLSSVRINNNKSILDEPPGPMAHHLAAVDSPGTHNMLVVGQESVFLSHLPMFKPHDTDSPHRYQVILEATLAKVGLDPQTAYAIDRKGHPATRIYTLSPQKFILPHLNSANANPSISTFRADLFRGHLEKEGTERIIEGADVSIRNVIHFRELDSNAPKLNQLEYILFGKGSELFLAHVITSPPDFDQVISIAIKDHTFTDEDLRKGLRVVFTRPNTVAGRLLEKQEATGELRLAEGTSPQKLKVKVGVEFYFEDGELRVPATFETTPAERRARFP